MQTISQRLKPVHFLLILVVWIFLASPAIAVAPSYTPKAAVIAYTSAKPSVAKDAGLLALVNKQNSLPAGFIIRYLKGKEAITGYQYEPWHLRYVGKAAAKAITERNLVLEEYLGRK